MKDKKTISADSSFKEMIAYGKRYLRSYGFFRGGARSILAKYKEIGFYTPKCEDFMLANIFSDPNVGSVLKSYMMSLRRIPQAGETITDEVWLSSIEIAMWMYNPLVVMKKSNWLEYYSNILPQVYVVVWLQMSSGFTDAYKDFGELRKLEEQLATLTKQAEELELEKKRRSDANLRAEGLATQVRKLQKETDSLVHEATKPLIYLLESKDKKIDLLERKLEALRHTDEEDEVSEDILENKKFPESVVFVGGHVNLQKKIREDHPTWRFIEAGDSSSGMGQEVECVIIHTGYIDHATYYKCVSQFSGIPTLYATGTNLDKIYVSLQEQWNKI